MICYLVRHGKDDDTVRGGWSNSPLTEEGVTQANILAEYVKKNNSAFSIKRIYSSDLVRARQTAVPLSEKLNVPITYMPEFREVDNGKLAGMSNEVAKIQYPGLYWNTLDWDQKYPEGESPAEFYERIKNAWELFSDEIIHTHENVLLVTHSGVINVIRCIINGFEYSNKHKYPDIPHTELIPIEYTDATWREINT